ncbi:MAG TPA: LysM domain-containing protein, partial [Candidatus Limnocylindrales bacterium]|nr:LysM domain-containing protein [Candidatus Limnocylindrales bacterium]
DGSQACPFVAFEDDRDERADRPDHRHRCFAEAVPAPRALAHQEAYCLSSAFPVCPTFQEWARREAAQARPGRAGTAENAAAAAAGAAAGEEREDESGDGDGADDVWGPRDLPPEERPRRNPPRSWAAPPPWAAGAGAAGAGAVGPGASGAAGGLHGGDPAPDAVPEEGRGLAGSAADRLASGDDPGHAWIGQPPARPRSAGADAPIGPSAPPDPELAGLVGRRASERGRGDDLDDAADEPRARSTRRPTVSSTRDRSRDRDRERERNGQPNGPSWERVRRYEAYPSIKARAGLPSAPQLPRIAVLFGALVVAALLLFLLPTVLNIGGRVVAPDASASPSDVAASASLEPTPIPEPTPQIYTIKAGDALARIARRFGLTLEQLLTANPDIKDANRIKVGDKIVIPTPPPEEVPAASPSASAVS